MSNTRRDFLKNVGVGSLTATLMPVTVIDGLARTKEDQSNASVMPATSRPFNGAYTGDHLNRFAFPLGGIGSGMFCIEGNGAFSHMSVRHKPDV